MGIEPVEEAVFGGEGDALADGLPHADHAVLGLGKPCGVVGVDAVVCVVHAKRAVVEVCGMGVHGGSFQKGMVRAKISTRVLRVVRVRLII